MSDAGFLTLLRADHSHIHSGERQSAESGSHHRLSRTRRVGTHPCLYVDSRVGGNNPLDNAVTLSAEVEGIYRLLLEIPLAAFPHLR